MTEHSKAILSIIIPIGPEETAWEGLLSDLIRQSQPKDSIEIILSATESEPLTFHEKRSAIDIPMKWVVGQKGRATQLNRGASVASGEFLWFLHADTRLSDSALSSLIGQLHREDKSLFYFNLRFLNDGPWLTILNETGVWLRSHLLGLPFGDQGFALKSILFLELGRFSENAEYGEDHLFVWSARRRGIRLRALGIPLYTSARRYRQKGWLRTTFRHMGLTFRQAIPEWFKLLEERSERKEQNIHQSHRVSGSGVQGEGKMP